MDRDCLHSHLLAVLILSKLLNLRISHWQNARKSIIYFTELYRILKVHHNVINKVPKIQLGVNMSC